MLIECLVQRDGPTIIQVAGKNFQFKPNEHGHLVCEVPKLHVAAVLCTNDFREYMPPDDDETAPSEVLDGLLESLASVPEDDDGPSTPRPVEPKALVLGDAAGMFKELVAKGDAAGITGLVREVTGYEIDPHSLPFAGVVAEARKVLFKSKPKITKG